MSAVFAGFLANIRAQGTPSIVERLRSDNGTEFTKGEFVTLLDYHRIRREYTPVDSPEYDGVVERRIALVLEAAMESCLEAPHLFGGVPLPPTGPLWAEACVHASDAINVSARVSDTSWTCCRLTKSCLVGHRSRDCSHFSSPTSTI